MSDAKEGRDRDRSTVPDAGGGRFDMPSRAGTRGTFWGQRHTCVGVDIGSHSVKVVQVRPRGDVPFIANFGELAVPQDAVAEDAIAEPREVGRTLRELFYGRRIRRRRVVCGLGGSRVILRRTQFVPMTARELAEVLRWEAEKYIPIPSEEAVVDFSILNEQSGQMNVLVAGTHQRTSRTYVEALRAARLSPAALEPEAMAQARVLEALGFRRTTGDEAAMLVDLGAATSRVTLFAGHVPLLTRNVGFGGEQLTQAVCEARGCAWGEGEELKREHGVLPEGPIADVVRGTAAGLVDELRRSAEFYSAQHRGRQIHGIYLVGGGARLKGLAELLREQLAALLGDRLAADTGVIIAGPSDHVRLRGPLAGLKPYFGPQFATALGLAMRGAKQS